MSDHSSPSAPTDLHDAIAEQAMTWLARLRADSVTAAERMQFQIWYRADPRHRLAYDEAVAFWEDEDFRRALAAASLSADVTLQPSKPERPSTKTRISRPLLAMAACIALAAIVYRPTLDCWQADYCTAVGEIKTVQLNDGSQVTLNSATALSVDFRNGLRQVKLLHGEAFFDVRRDPKQPFLVGGHFSSTRVLGTRFAVREDAESDRVNVVSGVVEVSQNRQKPAILKADDGITVDAEHSGEIRHRTTSGATAWLKGSAIFDNATLEEVIADFGRYRHGKLLIKNGELKELRVSGRFDIRNTDQALEALQQTLPIRVYKITPWLVVIG